MEGTRGISSSPHLEVMRSVIEDFNRMFEGWPYVPAHSPPGAVAWPRIEMFQRGGNLVVRAELPGLEREDVRVRVQEEMLIIEGERRSDVESRREGYYESEWTYGRFSRRVPLPAGVDVDEVRAEFRNGVLEVTVGLRSPAAREITIQGASGEAAERKPGGPAREASERERESRGKDRDRTEAAGSRERGGTTA